MSVSLTVSLDIQLCGSGHLNVTMQIPSYPPTNVVLKVVTSQKYFDLVFDHLDMSHKSARERLIILVCHLMSSECCRF